jgi:hypothetical protein
MEWDNKYFCCFGEIDHLVSVRFCEEATLSRRPVLLNAHSDVRVPFRTVDPYNFEVPHLCFISSRGHNSGNRLLFETDWTYYLGSPPGSYVRGGFWLLYHARMHLSMV